MFIIFAFRYVYIYIYVTIVLPIPSRFTVTLGCSSRKFQASQYGNLLAAQAAACAFDSAANRFLTLFDVKKGKAGVSHVCTVQNKY